jgi:hypothetical protein
MDITHNENPPSYNLVVHDTQARYTDLESAETEEGHRENPREGRGNMPHREDPACR